MSATLRRAPDGAPAPTAPAAAAGPAHSHTHTVDPAGHLKWARTIARGVRADYGFHAGSQEEKELEATAWLVVCEYAARFDPRTASRRGAAAAIEAACRRWRAGRRIPAGVAAVPFAGEDQAGWAAELAAAVAHRRQLCPADAWALAAVARAVAADRAAAFDTPGAFRGWAAVEVRSRCRREAVRLRNGGTFHTVANLAWGWQVTGLPGCDDEPDADEDGGGSRRDEVPRQLQVRDPEPDESPEWVELYQLWLEWCLALTRTRVPRRPAVRG